MLAIIGEEQDFSVLVDDDDSVITCGELQSGNDVKELQTGTRGRSDTIHFAICGQAHEHYKSNNEWREQRNVLGRDWRNDHTVSLACI